MSSEEKGGAGRFFYTIQERGGLNHVGEIRDGKVGRNNRLSFSETKVCAFRIGFKQRLVVLRQASSSLCFACFLSFPGLGLFPCDNRLFRPTTVAQRVQAVRQADCTGSSPGDPARITPLALAAPSRIREHDKC